MKTFRELDEATGQPKGAAFRAFKRLEPGLREGQDFLLLRPEHDDTRIDELRAQERIYRNSVNIVLLDDALAERLLKHLCGTLESRQ